MCCVEGEGHDVASVQSLARKHDIIERDLAAVGAKLSELFSEVCIGEGPYFDQSSLVSLS